MHFKIAYLKLTVFYVAVIMLISVAFSVAIYNISAQEVGKGLGRQSAMMRDVQENSPLFQAFEDIRQSQIDEINANVRRNLVYFNLLILLISTVASYFFAKWTLRPIEESVEAQNRFTADASHELRTPLTAMRTEIEVALRDRELNLAKSKELLASNLDEIAKLESLSGALLKLARHDNKNGKVHSTLNISDVLVEAYERVESLARAKNIKFDNKLVEAKVRGDKPSLVELFVILLDNAVKYSPKNKEIGIKMEKKEHFVIINIIDHGVGIKNVDLPHIFERFYRADQSRNKEKADGYGLGLAIAKNITEIHGGSISAKSKPGEGSEFSVKIPSTS